MGFTAQFKLNWKQISASFLACCLSALLAILMASSAVAETKTIKGGFKFDHTKTGFALIGQHAAARCETCHINGIFKGTPRQCSGCHVDGNRMNAPAKPSNHIKTTAKCETCHTSTASFKGAAMSHTGITTGCASCHNGTTAKGKSTNHISTTATCETCHSSTTSFKGGKMNHTGITTGCASCHNGTTAKGKSTNHIATTATCETCHKSTTSFAGTVFNHTGVAVGSCATCHGKTSTGKPATHIPTTASCDLCHRTTGFVPATMNQTRDRRAAILDGHRLAGRYPLEQIRKMGLCLVNTNTEHRCTLFQRFIVVF